MNVYQKAITKFTANKNGEIISNHSGKVIKTRDDQDGYQLFNFRFEGKHHTCKAHIFVWFFFRGFLPPKGFEIDHKDRVRHNNELCNLESISKEFNLKRRVYVVKDNQLLVFMKMAKRIDELRKEKEHGFEVTKVS